MLIIRSLNLIGVQSWTYLTKESVNMKGKILNPTGMTRYNNMAAISLLWSTNMIAVTS